jgi:anti-sigma factor RsiW
MMDERDLDARLQTEFEEMRKQDAMSAPAFGPMLARARAAAPVPSVPTGIAPLAPAPAWTHTRRLALGAPLLLAAALGAIWIIPDWMKEREFERTVSEWSLQEATLRSPTDGLLMVPGSEFLGRAPSFGGPATRRGS